MRKLSMWCVSQSGLADIRAWVSYMGVSWCGEVADAEAALEHSSQAVRYLLVGKDDCVRKATKVRACALCKHFHVTISLQGLPDFSADCQALPCDTEPPKRPVLYLLAGRDDCVVKATKMRDCTAKRCPHMTA